MDPNYIIEQAICSLITLILSVFTVKQLLAGLRMANLPRLNRDMHRCCTVIMVLMIIRVIDPFNFYGILPQAITFTTGLNVSAFLVVVLVIVLDAQLVVIYRLVHEPAPPWVISTYKILQVVTVLFANVDVVLMFTADKDLYYGVWLIYLCASEAFLTLIYLSSAMWLLNTMQDLSEGGGSSGRGSGSEATSARRAHQPPPHTHTHTHTPPHSYTHSHSLDFDPASPDRNAAAFGDSSWPAAHNYNYNSHYNYHNLSGAGTPTQTYSPDISLPRSGSGSTLFHATRSEVSRVVVRSTSSREIIEKSARKIRLIMWVLVCFLVVAITLQLLEAVAIFRGRRKDVSWDIRL
jgi:hypothetical protein